MGVKPPEPPEYDSEVQQILNTFYLVSRSRRYVDNRPLRLSVRDITDVVEIHPVSVNRGLLDAVIFELDEYVLEQIHKQSKDKIAQ